MKRALFLDRDGVINEDGNYVHRIDDLHFIDGIFDICRAAASAGMAIIVVTNQAGIGRGLFTERQFHVLTDWMVAQFAAQGVRIAQVYYCPHHPVHGKGHFKLDCLCRKPNPGMILLARDDHGICLKSSILIGDKEWDIAAANAAGIETTVLIAAPEMEPKIKARFQFGNLKEALVALVAERLL